MDRSRPEKELRMAFKFCMDSIESSSIKKYHAQLLFKPGPLFSISKKPNPTPWDSYFKKMKIVFYLKKITAEGIRQADEAQTQDFKTDGWT
jgi:hypothetical protein